MIRRILCFYDDICFVIHIGNKHARADDHLIVARLAVVVRLAECRHLRIEDIIVRNERYITIVRTAHRAARNDTRTVFYRKVRLIRFFGNDDRRTDAHHLAKLGNTARLRGGIGRVLYFFRHLADKPRKNTVL